MPEEMSPLQAIRAKCIDCMINQIALVRECDITTCSLNPFRMGRNPYRKQRKMTDEQRAALGARLLASRAKRMEIASEN